MSLKALAALTDPTDFQASKIPKLFELDSLLRCHICKEFLVAPMLTSCGHSFCSMCIRKYLIHTPKCPICAKELRESHLNRNVLMEQVVMSYKDLRPDLLTQLAVEKETERSVRREQSTSRKEVIEVEDFVSDSFEEDDIQIIEEHTKKRKSPNGHGIDALFKRKKQEPKKSDVEMGECPVCQRFYPLNDLQTTHIDLCLAGKVPEPEPAIQTPSVQRSSSVERPSRSSSMTPSTEAPASTFSYFLPKEPTSSYTKLTKLDFLSLSTSMLKSKLLKLDLPSTGTRTQLETRYNEYLILWNANCDSVSPRDARVLRKQLAQWESSLAFKVKSKKQLDKEGWRDLIDQARNSLKRKQGDEGEEKDMSGEPKEVSGVSGVPEEHNDLQEDEGHEESIVIKSQSQERFFED